MTRRFEVEYRPDANGDGWLLKVWQDEVFLAPGRGVYPSREQAVAEGEKWCAWEQEWRASEQREGRQLSALAETFPSLRGAPGVRPWEPMTLLAWALKERNNNELEAAAFMLYLARDLTRETDWLQEAMDAGLPRPHYGDGWTGMKTMRFYSSLTRFDVFCAIANWDAEHRAAFAAWAAAGLDAEPNAATVDAIREARAGGLPAFGTVDELIDDLDEEGTTPGLLATTKVGDWVLSSLCSLSMVLRVTAVTKGTVICGEKTFDRATGLEMDEEFGCAADEGAGCEIRPLDQQELQELHRNEVDGLWNEISEQLDWLDQQADLDEQVICSQALRRAATELVALVREAWGIQGKEAKP